MTEDEYVVVSELAKVRMASTILSDVLMRTDRRSIRAALSQLEHQLYQRVEEMLDAGE